MEEIKSLHELSLEWGCITNLFSKIIDIEEVMGDEGWPELIDMLGAAVDAESNNPDPAKVFFDLYAYVFHVYYRLRGGQKREPFNQYSKEGEEYWVKNYNYEAFKWAKTLGVVDTVDNNIIKIPVDKLTDNQRRALDRRIKKEV